MTAIVGGHRVLRAIALQVAVVVLPSVLAAGAVVWLLTYGEAGHTISRIAAVVVAALAVCSVAVAWINATHLVQRLFRLTQATRQDCGLEGVAADGFDRIEQIRGNFGSASPVAQEERERLEAPAAASLRDRATMLAAVVSDSISQLDEVRLPLQILLESPFGELNENQEELLRDARAAADAIDVSLRRLARVTDLDRGVSSIQREPVQVNDVVRSVLPLARAAAERCGARTEVELEPGLPRVFADRARLAEALALFMTDSASASGPEASLCVSTMHDGAGALIQLAPVGPGARAVGSPARDDEPRFSWSPSLLFAMRLIGAQHGDVIVRADAVVLRVGESTPLRC